MKQMLFPTIEAMLDPETLSALLGMKITAVSTHPLHAQYALSGSRLLKISTNEGSRPTLILKRISTAWDWQMRATNDINCRSVALWQHGILDSMPPEIDTATIACAHDGGNWAVLLHDKGAALLPYRRLSNSTNAKLLDGMAAMHQRFFADPRIEDQALGLCSIEQVYSVFAPSTGRAEIGGDEEIPQRILEGWGIVESMVDKDVAKVVYELIHDPSLLCDALRRYPKTLVHGDWRHANLGVNGNARVIVLDWQLAVAAPPAVELGRCLGTISTMFPTSKENVIAYYKQQLQQRLGKRFDNKWWLPQLKLGLLGGFVQDGWAIALKATHWHVGADARDHWLADLKWWSDRVREGMAYL